MYRLIVPVLFVCLVAMGCSNGSAGGKAEESKGGEAKAGDGKAANSLAEMKGVAIADGVAALSGENSKIEFVGLHTDPNKRDPRKGGFKTFSGKAMVDGKTLKAVEVDIKTESVYTEFEKLTNHLKSPDFFDVRQYPKAKFVSTKIEPAGEGKVNITGDLTLLKETKSITFPAAVEIAAGKEVKMLAEFTIDRTQFGMSFGAEQVEKDVSMTISIGK